MSEEDGPRPKLDVVFVHGRAGENYRVIRKRDEVIEIGEIRPLAEGKPLQGDLVKLTQRKEHEQLFDVETVMTKEEAHTLTARSGPARVATRAYRENWEAIFGDGGEGELSN